MFFKHPLRKLIIRLFTISLFFHLLAAFLTVGYHYPDEYFQITEFASYKLGKTPASHLAWEFNAEMRPALQPAMIYMLCKITQITNPAVISLLLRLFSAVAAWSVTALFVLICLRQIRSDDLKKVILYLSVFFWFMPYLHARFSSENWSGIFFFAGLSIFMVVYHKEEDVSDKPEQEENRKSFLWRFLSPPLLYLLSGIIMGFSSIVRFQSGLMIAGFALWLPVYGKLKYKYLFLIASGILCSLFVGVLADRWFYGKWTFTALNYFRINILEGKASEWGVMPWWDYFKMLFINTIPPFSLIIIAAIFIFFFRHYKHVLAWICLPFFIFHLMAGHKELRFLFPLVTALPVVVGLAFDGEVNSRLLLKFKNFILFKTSKILTRIYLLINVLLMLVICVKPANEAFVFYDFIYSKYHHKQINLYTSSGNPYVLVEVPVDFFKPMKLNVISFSVDSVFDQITHSEDTVNLLLETGFTTDKDFRFANREANLVFENIPEWIKDFNYNNWLRRTKIWRLYEIK